MDFLWSREKVSKHGLVTRGDMVIYLHLYYLVNSVIIAYCDCLICTRYTLEYMYIRSVLYINYYILCSEANCCRYTYYIIIIIVCDAPCVSYYQA